MASSVRDMPIGPAFDLRIAKMPVSRSGGAFYQSVGELGSRIETQRYQNLALELACGAHAAVQHRSSVRHRQSGFDESPRPMAKLTWGWHEMNVIVFASRKGGSGKSMLTAHVGALASKRASCLLIDADPQGSLTLWHKLRGTAEPVLRSGTRGVGEIVKAAKREHEWAFIATPPNMSAVVADAIRAATLVIIPARLAVFDLAAIKETIELARGNRVPYAVVINAA